MRGGGNFLTQSYPTNFHGKWTQKILVGNEKPEDFMEVTAKEMEALEKSDAKWVRPPQWLIDIFNADPNGRYDKATGCFHLNKLVLTTQEAVNIAYYGRAFSEGMYCSGPKIRTNLCLLGQANATYSVAALFKNQSELEVANVTPYFGPLGWSYSIIPSDGYNNEMFLNCRKLHTIYGKIDCIYLRANASLFGGCVSLREVRLDRVARNINLADCASLSLASLQHLVANAANTSPIIVTVHPFVYGKLTNEANAEWYKVLTDAMAKNISFATTASVTTTGVGLRLKSGEQIDGGYLDDDFTIDLASVEAIYVDTPKIRRYIMPLPDDVCFSDGSTKCPGINCGEGRFTPFNGKENSELLRATHAADVNWAVNVAYSTIIAGRHCWLPSYSEFDGLVESRNHIVRLLTMCGIDWFTSSIFWTSTVSNRSSMPNGGGDFSEENNDTTRDYYLRHIWTNKNFIPAYRTVMVTRGYKVLAMTDME